MPVDTVRTLAEGIMADVTEDLAALVRIPSCAFPGFPSAQQKNDPDKQ